MQLIVLVKFPALSPANACAAARGHGEKHR